QAGGRGGREVEGGDAGTEREGGEGVSEIVDPAQGLEAGRHLRGLPLSFAEGVWVEVAASLGRKDKRAVCTQPLAFDRLERDRLQRHRPPARFGLRALQPSLRERAVDVDNPRSEVDVAPFEREPLGRTKSGGSREKHHRPKTGRRMRGDTFAPAPPL